MCAASRRANVEQTHPTEDERSEWTHAEPGTEVIFVWGEEGGGSSKPTVEPHVQTEIRAIVSPAPYVEVARKEYRS